MSPGELSRNQHKPSTPTGYPSTLFTPRLRALNSLPCVLQEYPVSLICAWELIGQIADMRLQGVLEGLCKPLTLN